MLFKLALVCLAIAAATAQNKCIDNASAGADGKCACNPGFEGHPDLCCHDPSATKACFVAGDPVLTSYYGTQIGHEFPCGTVLSSTQDGACTVNVIHAANEIRDGVIFSTMIKVVLSNADGTRDFTIGASPQPFMSYVDNSQDQYLTIQGSETSTAFGSFGDVVTSVDSGLVTVSVCNTVINTRLADYTNDNMALQGVPATGVCVMPRASAVISGVDQSCALNFNSATASSSEVLTNLIKPLQNYLFAPSNVAGTFASAAAKAKCDKFQSEMINDCERTDRENAFKQCAFVLFQPLIRRCFSESRGNVLDPFLECLSTYCKGTKDTCDALKAQESSTQCAPSLLDCESWAPFRTNNRFVAGEGDDFQFGDGDTGGDSGAGGAGGTGGGFDPLSQEDGILGGGGQGNDNEDTAGGVGGGFDGNDFGF